MVLGELRELAVEVGEIVLLGVHATPVRLESRSAQLMHEQFGVIGIVFEN